jgi:hypothetical protein
VFIPTVNFRFHLLALFDAGSWHTVPLFKMSSRRQYFDGLSATGFESPQLRTSPHGEADTALGLK